MKAKPKNCSEFKLISGLILMHLILSKIRSEKISEDWMRSIWKSSYNVLDEADQQKFTITEDNAWVKFFDGMVGEIPIVGMFTGYFLNPSYTVKGMDGKEYFKLKKMPSMFGRRFQLDRLIDIDDEDESLVVLSLLMMVLLERARG